MCSKGIEACKEGEYCLDRVCSGIDVDFVLLWCDLNSYISLSSIMLKHNQQYPLIHWFLEVDGSWDEWGEWSTCQECSRGVMKRTRVCNVKGNGRQCVGKAEEFKSGMNGVFDNYIKTMNGLSYCIA